jgi:hypothetical protein
MFMFKVEGRLRSVTLFQYWGLRATYGGLRLRGAMPGGGC